MVVIWSVITDLFFRSVINLVIFSSVRINSKYFKENFILQYIKFIIVLFIIIINFLLSDSFWLVVYCLPFSI